MSQLKNNESSGQITNETINDVNNENNSFKNKVQSEK